MNHDLLLFFPVFHEYYLCVDWHFCMICKFSDTFLTSSLEGRCLPCCSCKFNCVCHFCLEWQFIGSSVLTQFSLTAESETTSELKEGQWLVIVIHEDDKLLRDMHEKMGTLVNYTQTHTHTIHKRYMNICWPLTCVFLSPHTSNIPE